MSKRIKLEIEAHGKEQGTYVQALKNLKRNRPVSADMARKIVKRVLSEANFNTDNKFNVREEGNHVQITAVEDARAAILVPTSLIPGIIQRLASHTTLNPLTTLMFKTVAFQEREILKLCKTEFKHSKDSCGGGGDARKEKDTMTNIVGSSIETMLKGYGGTFRCFEAHILASQLIGFYLESNQNCSACMFETLNLII